MNTYTYRNLLAVPNILNLAENHSQLVLLTYLYVFSDIRPLINKLSDQQKYHGDPNPVYITLSKRPMVFLSKP